MIERREGCRIVVSLKAASHVESPVEAAATLAAAIEAEIVGLFVKEDAMIDLAGLPFARTLGFGTGRSQALTRDAMERAFSRGEILCRRTLSARAERAQVKWSFQTMRGEVAGGIRSALGMGDFLVLSRERRGGDVSDVMGEVRSGGTGVRGIVVASQRFSRPDGGPVIAIDEGGAGGEETILLASRIAAVTGTGLVVLAVAHTDEEAGRIADRSRELAGLGSNPDIHRFPSGDPRWIAAALARSSPSFVVADMEGDLFRNDEDVRRLLDASAAPIALVRAADGQD